MPIFPEEYVQKLQSEFEALTNYESKLSFYEKVFKIIPYEFPPFTTSLSVIFGRTEIQEIIRNALRERTRKSTLEKVFSYAGRKYIFSIHPEDGSVQVYNTYVFTLFLESNITIPKAIERDTEHFAGIKPTFSTLLKSAQEKIEEVESIVNGSNIVSHQDKFAVEFYHGFQAAKNGGMPDLSTLKKLHTLYFYALGMWFHKYLSRLSDLERGVELLDEKQSPTEKEGLKARIQLMQDLGIIKFLTDDFSSRFPEDVKYHVAEVICKILGEPDHYAEYILRLMHKG